MVVYSLNGQEQSVTVETGQELNLPPKQGDQRGSPPANETQKPAANAQQLAPSGTAKEYILEKEATIAGLKRLKSGGGSLYRPGVPAIQPYYNMKMTLDGADEVTLTSRTMIYMLTEDNTEAFAKKSKSARLDEVYKGMTGFQALASMRELALERQRKGESLSGPQRAYLEAYLKEEDERHRIFGPSVKLVKGMEIYLYSDKQGIAHAVLVKYTDKATKGIANTPAQSKPSK